jgi:hypothetical protein
MKISGKEEANMHEMIIFINAVGQNFAFARKICKSMSDFKQKDKKPLSKEELGFIKSVNDFYKKERANISFDALECFGIDNKDSKVSFVKKAMKDMDNPRNSDYLYAKEIYVPALKMENGVDFEEKALIKGD